MGKNLNEIAITNSHSRIQSPLLVGFLVFLITIFTFCALAVSGSLQNLRHINTNKYTVSFTNTDMDIKPASKHKTNRKKLLDEIRQVISENTKITHFEIISDSIIRSILTPLHDDIQTIKTEELPILVDFYVQKETNFSTEPLQKKLHKLNSEIEIYTQDQLDKSVNMLGITIKLTTSLFASIIGATVLMLIGLITRGALRENRHVINTLRLIGATTTYVGRQFQWHALKLASLGSFSGTILGLTTLFGLNFIAPTLGVENVFQKLFDIETIGILLAIPVVISISSLIVSRLSVSQIIQQIES